MVMTHYILDVKSVILLAVKKSSTLKKVVCMYQSLSRVRLLVTPWTVARQAPLSVEISRQEYWSGLLFPSPIEEGFFIVFPIFLSAFI